MTRFWSLHISFLLSSFDFFIWITYVNLMYLYKKKSARRNLVYGNYWSFKTRGDYCPMWLDCPVPRSRCARTGYFTMSDEMALIGYYYGLELKWSSTGSWPLSHFCFLSMIFRGDILKCLLAFLLCFRFSDTIALKFNNMAGYNNWM